MKVVVINIVSLNPGDAAILQGTLEILRQAFGDDISVTVFDRDGEAAASYYPWADFRPAPFDVRGRGRLAGLANRRGWVHRLYRLDALRYRSGGALLARGLDVVAAAFLSAAERAALRSFLDADFVISNGGTYLVPHYNLLRPILTCELALALNKPLVFFPQSMGPFENTHFRPRLHRVFSRALRIIARDERSARNVRQLDIPGERIMVSADAAFALTLPATDRPRRDERPARPRIAISVRDWAHFAKGNAADMQLRYTDAIAAAASHLVRRHNAEVTFISTCQGMPEYWIDDSVCANGIVSRLDADIAAHVTVDSAFRQPTELMQELAGYDAVIATRMHAAILALCAGVPVLPIAYEFKTRELFRAMQLEEWVTDIEEMESESFSARAECFMTGLPLIRLQVQSAVAERNASALQVAAALRQLIPG